jgi:hypothetical protein
MMVCGGKPEGAIVMAGLGLVFMDMSNDSRIREWFFRIATSVVSFNRHLEVGPHFAFRTQLFFLPTVPPCLSPNALTARTTTVPAKIVQKAAR